jgi:hypothetical protein
MSISFWNTANLNPMIQVSSFIDGYLALKSCINKMVYITLRKKKITRPNGVLVNYYNGESLASATNL